MSSVRGMSRVLQESSVEHVDGRIISHSVISDPTVHMCPPVLR
jgi:hypothetical protein